MIPEIVSQILDLCKDIVAIKLIIHEARGGRLQKRCVELALRLKSKQAPSEDGLILLKTCFEDIYDYLMRFRVKDRDLAVKVIKDGSGEVHFVKLNEQILNCCSILDIKMESNESQDLQDLNEDCVVLKANLKFILDVFAVGPDSAKRRTVILPAFDHGILEMLEFQKVERPSYKSKRAPEESLTILPQNLEFVKPIGRGGFSTIWLGKYKDKDQVAIKLFNIDSSQSSMKEFQNEAEIMRRLSHRNITSYYGVANTDKGFTMVMEYMENDSLYAYLKNNQATPFEASKKVDIALDIARGIDFLHRLKIIHRDLKMGNVLLDSQFNAKISDFGLSIIKENQISMIPLLEAGTSSYMAPETFGAGALYSSKSDVFAFGILLWGLIHWSQPFGGVQREEIRQLVWKERYRLPISAGVPRPISSVISCCWAQSPVHRPAMSEVKDFLEKVVMIEGLITQNEIFSHEMTTQATEMDRTEKLATPVHNFIAALPKPGLINSMSNLQEVGQKTANAGLKSSHQIQPSIAGSESNIEVHGLAQRRAPTIPIVNQPEALGDDLARKLTNAVPRTAPSVPQSIKQPPISYMSKPPPSAMIPQSMSEGIFKSKSMSHKHEDIPKKLWFGRRREVVIAIFVFSIFAIAALISVIVVVANMNFKAAQTSEGESTLSTTSPPPTPTCIIKNPKKVLSTGCKTRNANVSTFAGSFNNRGNFNGPRLNPALYVPYGLAFLPNGSLVISDYYGFNIITGNNLYSPPYLAGTGLAMRGFSVDSDGIMYVPVEGRYIAAVDTRTSVVTVFAGNTSTNGTKDSIDLLDAQFSYIVGTMLYEGLMYVVDRGLPGTRSSIRVIDYCPYSPTPGVKIFQASGLSQKSHSSAMDQEGNIYYSTDSHCISKFILANNTVLPCFAGTNNGVGVSDGPPGFGRFDTPKGLAFDSCGNLFVADTNNNLIRVVDKDGVISTVDTDISIQSPTSLAFSPGGNLYFSQQSYHIVRRAALW